MQKVPDQSIQLRIRNSSADDGPDVFRMVQDSKVLDVNSRYAYLLMLKDFASTCFVAETDKSKAGFMIGYIPPSRPDSYFIWQIYVIPVFRRTGLAFSMIDHAMRDMASDGIRYIEATVNPSNSASNRLFNYLSKIYRTECRTDIFFNKSSFPDCDHEEEVMHRVGPIDLKES